MAWRERLTDNAKDVARAVAFLSRIPAPNALFTKDTHSAAAQQAWAYPLAGLVIGLPGALIIAAAGATASPLLTAMLAIAATTLITGGLHEDGLADIADGFWGGWTKERRLEIMKGSTVGAYGVLALVTWFGLISTALADTITMAGPASAALAWLAVCAVSRAAMTALWATTPPARNTGVAHGAGQPSAANAAVAAITGTAIVVLSMLVGASVWLLVALLVAAAATAALRLVCLRKIDGHTGDTLGAAQKIAELTMLVSLAIVL